MILYKIAELARGELMIVSNLALKPEYIEKVKELNKKGWPEFLLHWKCPSWKRLFTDLSDFQILLLDGIKLAGFGHCVPIFIEGNIISLEEDLAILIDRAAQQFDSKIKANHMLVLSAVVGEDYKGKGLSFEILNAFKKKAAEEGFKSAILPTRPTMKHKYPLIPIAEYALWKDAEGRAFDPWTRAHEKMGGQIFRTSEACMTVKGTASQWREWTGLDIPATGQYIIKGGLRPMSYDREKDLGVYTVPAIWMEYRLEGNKK